jgi:vacuolar-type H+-ATPase subunit E/Vma4
LVSQLEEEAEKITADAKMQAEARRSEAAAEAEKASAEGLRRAEADASAIHDEARSTLEKEAAELKSKELARTKETIERAGGKVQDAVQLVLKKLKGQS